MKAKKKIKLKNTESKMKSWFSTTVLYDDETFLFHLLMCIALWNSHWCVSMSKMTFSVSLHTSTILSNCILCLSAHQHVKMHRVFPFSNESNNSNATQRDITTQTRKRHRMNNDCEWSQMVFDSHRHTRTPILLNMRASTSRLHAQ